MGSSELDSELQELFYFVTHIGIYDYDIKYHFMR